MEQSILKSTKKILGVGPEDDSFDLDIMTHINSAFFTLRQLGVGPVNGFHIESDAVEWGDFLPLAPEQLHIVKTIIWLRVRLLFDPPTSSFLLDAANKQLQEMEWRLNVDREETDWVDPNPVVVVVVDDV